MGRRHETGTIYPGLYDGNRSDPVLLGVLSWECLLAHENQVRQLEELPI